MLQRNSNLRNSVYCNVLDRGNKACMAVTSKFNAMTQRLLQTPKTVQELVAMSKFLEACPLSVEMLTSDLAHAIADFDLLESERWTIPSESFTHMWHASVLPKLTRRRMLICQRQLATLREEMRSNTARKLSVLTQRFETLTEQVSFQLPMISSPSRSLF
jgi:hypothetical protein